MKDGDRTTRLVRSLRGGQITIPAEFRKELGIGEESVLQVTLSNGELRLRPVEVRETVRGSPWLQALYDRFAPTRDEATTMSEEEVNAAIDEAIAASRASRA